MAIQFHKVTQGYDTLRQSTVFLFGFTVGSTATAFLCMSVIHQFMFPTNQIFKWNSVFARCRNMSEANESSKLDASEVQYHKLTFEGE